MPTGILNNEGAARRVLARVPPRSFVGRREELGQVTGLAARGGESLLMSAAPSSGASELLRQAFDALFNQRGPSPIYFAFARGDFTAQSAARRFLHAFLLHLVAHHRNDPALIAASPAMRELVDLSNPTDYVWIEALVTACERARAGGDEREEVRLCLNAPREAAARGARTVVLFDDVHVAAQLKGGDDLGAGLARLSGRGGSSFAFSGLRRQLSDILPGDATDAGLNGIKHLHLKLLSREETHGLLRLTATEVGVELSDETCDLVGHQFGGNLHFLTSFVRAARNRGVSLTSFQDCQKLYVDELFGGRIDRRYDSIIGEAVSSEEEAVSLIRVLHETASNVGGKTPLEVLRRRAGIEAGRLRHALGRLHAYELVNLGAAYVELADDLVWRDFLRVNFRLRVNAEPRARVVAQTLVEAVKRAPRTIARRARRESVTALRRLLGRFDCQRVPPSLLHYDPSAAGRAEDGAGKSSARTHAGTDLIRLPRIVTTAGCGSFYPSMLLVCEEEQCLVAHGFEDGPEGEANDVVWIAAEVETRIETGRALAGVWCDRLTQMAQACGFERARLWLVSAEGFSAEAGELLNRRGVYSSDRRQLESLAARLGPDAGAGGATAGMTDEFEMMIAAGGDTELIAAHAVERIARRLGFRPEAINQIKTALVEACINVAAQSSGGGKKVHQRLQTGHDRLVLTLSSRAGAAADGDSPGAGRAEADVGDEADNRRGWSLKLIRTLMDEVEFEVTNGETRLRMTKYKTR